MGWSFSSQVFSVGWTLGFWKTKVDFVCFSSLKKERAFSFMAILSWWGFFFHRCRVWFQGHRGRACLPQDRLTQPQSWMPEGREKVLQYGTLSSLDPLHPCQSCFKRSLSLAELGSTSVLDSFSYSQISLRAILLKPRHHRPFFLPGLFSSQVAA